MAELLVLLSAPHRICSFCSRAGVSFASSARFSPAYEHSWFAVYRPVASASLGGESRSIISQTIMDTKVVIMTVWPNKSPEPTALALAVPLSRFTPRVGGGSAFFVRHPRAYDNTTSPHHIQDDSGKTYFFVASRTLSREECVEQFAA